MKKKLLFLRRVIQFEIEKEKNLNNYICSFFVFPVAFECDLGAIQIIRDTLRQWFLTFFAPWTPKSENNFHGPL